MNVKQDANGRWVIKHAGKIVDKEFDEEADAWKWADRMIDDQVFDSDNHLSPPIQYRK